MANSNTPVKKIIAGQPSTDQSADSSYGVQATNESSEDIGCEDSDRRVYKIYYIQHCEVVYLNSFNHRTFKMQDCGNHLPQVNYHGATLIHQASNIELSHEEFSGFTPSTGSNPTDPLFRTQTTAVKSEDPKEIANVPLQTNNYYPCIDPKSLQRSDFSSGRARRELERLEQLLGPSLATAAVVRFSGNTLADVLTPRAHDAFKALYALASCIGCIACKFRAYT